MSKLLVRSQLDGVLGAQAQRVTGGATAGASAQRATKMATTRTKGLSDSRRARRKAKQLQGRQQAHGGGRPTAATPLDELRKDIAKSRNHLATNVAALSLTASTKRRRQTAALTRKLLQSRLPPAATDDGSSSSDDEDRVDMYSLLRKMQSKGL
jgi:hypothetical protein